MPIHLPADNLGVMMIRARSIAMVGVLALFLAACGGGSGESTTTSPTQPQTTTTAVPMEPVQVSYALEAGQTYTFELEMDQTIEFTSTGDSAAIESEDLPGNMTMRVFGPTTVTYQVADGPQPDTYELTITSDLSGLQFDAEVDGAPVERDELPEFADLEPQATTIVVDKQGKPLEGAVPGMDDPFGGLFGDFDLGAMGDMGSQSMNPTQFFGPALPEEGIEIGDTWTETTEIPLFGDDKATTTVTSTFDRMEELDGRDVMVIDTVVSSSEIEFDLAELLLALFEGFMPEDPSEEDLAMFEQFRDSMRFLFHVDAAEQEMTTWFDAEAGVAVRTETGGSNRIRMDVNVPDEETGEMVSFSMDMSITQSMTFRLLEGPST